MRVIALKKCQRIHVLSFATDGTRLLAIGGPDIYESNVAISIDVASGAEIGRVEFFAPTCYNVDPALTHLVIGTAADYGSDAVVEWIPLSGDSRWQEFSVDGAKRICDVAFDGSGTRLAVTSEPRRGRGRCKAEVYRFAPKKAPKLLSSMPTAKPAGAIAFSADGTRLAVGAGLGGVDAFEVFDLKSGRRAFRFNPPSPDRRCVRFLPDGRLIAGAGSKVYILPVRGGKPQFTLGTSRAFVNDVAVPADGRRITVAMNNGTLQTWDTATGQAGPRFTWGVGGVWCTALAPDGLTCAAAGSRGRIVIWDVE
jgi:WD40 repeat protein